MKLHRSILLLVALVLLAGCKTKVETVVNLSDILNGKTKSLPGDLYVEVSACNSYEDSRLPSKSLTEAQENIPSVFADATYIECYSEKFKSFAHFSVPIMLDKDDDGQMASGSHINIVSTDQVLLRVTIPARIKANMEQVKRKSFGAGSLELEMNIRIQNDTKEKFPFKVLSAYVDAEPYVYGDLSVIPGSSVLVTLSNVSVDAALKNGFSVVLLK